MRFARAVFVGAGIWGMVALVPLYFLVDLSGRRYLVPQESPHFFYGFISVAIAWQVAFLIIGADPIRHRRLMIPAILEKAGYIVGTVLLYLQGRIASAEAQSALPDAMLTALFVASWFKTAKRSRGSAT